MRLFESDCRVLMACLAVGFGLLLRPVDVWASDAADAPQPPIMETVLAERGIDAYIQQAEAYLAEHPQAPGAARVCIDMVMLATLRKDAGSVARYRAKLIADYADSPAGRYVATTFKNASSFMTFANAHYFDEPLKRLEPIDLALIHRLGSIYKQFDSQDQSDLGFRLMVVAARELAGDENVADSLVKYFDEAPQANKKLRQTAATFRIHKSRLADRALALAAIEDDKVAERLARFYIGQLPIAERQTPAMRGLCLRYLADGRAYEQMLPLIDAALASPATTAESAVRLRFLRGWAQMGLRQFSEAVEQWEQVAKMAPKSAWGELAKQLAAQLPHMDQRLAEQARLLARTLETLRGNTNVIEIMFDIQKDGQAYVIYVAYRHDPYLIEAHVAHQARVVGALRYDAQHLRVFLEGQDAVRQYLASAQPPVPTANIEQDPTTGEYTFNFKAWTGDFDSGLPGKIDQLLRSPLLREEGLHMMLQRLYAKNGRIAFPIEVDAQGARKLATVTVDLEAAELRHASITLGPDHVLRSIRGASPDGLADVTVRYGKGLGNHLKPPAWPDLPIDDRGALNQGDWLELMAEAGQFVSKWSEAWKQ